MRQKVRLAHFVIELAKTNDRFGFPITTLLRPVFNYARHPLKGGAIRRAIAKSIIAAHIDDTTQSEHERTRKQINAVHKNDKFIKYHATSRSTAA